MAKFSTIDAYNAGQTDQDRLICDQLRSIIDRALTDADSKIWHGHPVWFLAGNPIVGYAKLRNCVRLLFWSGQSFKTQGLSPEGTFKAAEIRYTTLDQIDPSALLGWLDEARIIQWDYKNIVKRRGRLEQLF